MMPDIVVKPATTEEVSGVLKICNAARQPLVPLGGKTGLAGGHFATGDEIGLSLERMNSIEEIDCHNRTMTVQAGCILQLAVEAAEEEGLLFPLDFGARGSATVGGNLATNAGGNMVIRYGMTREMVLGLEVVLADGTVITSLNKLLKNNTGYDLKHWFIGAEGTLGVITRAVLRLRPLPRSENTALLAVDTFEHVGDLLRWLDARTGGTLSSFEVMWPSYYEYITRDGYQHTPPLPHGSGYYVLVETLGSDPGSDALRFEEVLGAAFEEGLVTDAVIAQSDKERKAIWEIRDDVLELFNLGPIITYDISVTLDRMEDFVSEIQGQMDARNNSVCVIFGHLGDCNLHIILGAGDVADFDYDKLQDILYGTVARFDGSVSAEHGIGVLKRDQLPMSRSGDELRLMMGMKNMLDPNNILNPNKIFTAEDVSAA
ncbi:MAG: FAD-binding oxidoreductase [Halioglobus sp.]|nr:FAD-binding oxidoreductase [Halioglobus sp.]